MTKMSFELTDKQWKEMENTTTIVSVKMTQAQRYKFKLAAMNRGIDMSTLIRELAWDGLEMMSK